MIEHKLTLLGKEEGEMETIYFNDINTLIDILPAIYKDDLFYVELEPDIDNITLEEYKKLLLTNPIAKDFKFPNTIENVQDMQSWINSWKILEETFELSALS